MCTCFTFNKYMKFKLIAFDYRKISSDVNWFIPFQYALEVPVIYKFLWYHVTENEHNLIENFFSLNISGFYTI